jgi:hypothetical protein
MSAWSFEGGPRCIPEGRLQTAASSGTTRHGASAASISAYAIVVDAKDDGGRQFYASHGFISLPSRPNRLFLLVETASATLAESAVGAKKRSVRAFLCLTERVLSVAGKARD